jgi:Tol biopolymer transport system component
MLVHGVQNSEEVYVINADGSSRTALTSNSASDVQPVWSPDGTKITFASNRDGYDFEIYT